MAKYCVTVVQTGRVFVEAESGAEALDIANHQFGDAISWSDNWEAMYVEEDDSAEPEQYITERDF